MKAQSLVGLQSTRFPWCHVRRDHPPRFIDTKQRALPPPSPLVICSCCIQRRAAALPARLGLVEARAPHSRGGAGHRPPPGLLIRVPAAVAPPVWLGGLHPLVWLQCCGGRRTLLGDEHGAVRWGAPSGAGAKQDLPNFSDPVPVPLFAFIYVFGYLAYFIGLGARRASEVAATHTAHCCYNCYTCLQPCSPSVRHLCPHGERRRALASCRCTSCCPAPSPAPAAAAPAWSVLVSMLLCCAGVAVFKRWEMATPVHEQVCLRGCWSRGVPATSSSLRSSFHSGACLLRTAMTLLRSPHRQILRCCVRLFGVQQGCDIRHRGGQP